MAAKNEAKYSEIIKLSLQVVADGEKSDALCKEKLAPLVRDFYTTLENFKAVKAQYCADGIVPRLSSDYQRALGIALINANSKEYKALDSEQQRKQQEIRVIRNKATAHRDTYFRRIAEYAFSKPEKAKAEGGSAGETGDTSSATFEARLVSSLSDWIKKAQNNDKPNCDIGKLCKVLQDAVLIANTPIIK